MADETGAFSVYALGTLLVALSVALILAHPDDVRGWVLLVVGSAGLVLGWGYGDTHE